MLDRTKRVYQFIQDYINEYSYSPTRQEIAGGVGLRSKSAVQPHLEILQRDGLINITPKISRGITLANEGRQ